MRNTMELQELYETIKKEIEKRITEFDNIKSEADNKKMLKELVFCLMTPQSKAKTCAKVADEIFADDTVFRVSEKKLSDLIKNVRFRNNKAKYIKETIEKLKNTDIKEKIKEFENEYKAREWLVKNINGYGYKEASHFLRNTGFGYNLSILDRHILKNLAAYGVIKDIPKSMSPKKYLEIEKKMQNFSKKIRIPMHHLDFLLWYNETKEVFK